MFSKLCTMAWGRGLDTIKQRRQGDGFVISRLGADLSIDPPWLFNLSIDDFLSFHYEIANNSRQFTTGKSARRPIPLRFDAFLIAMPLNADRIWTFLFHRGAILPDEPIEIKQIDNADYKNDQSKKQ